MVLLTQPRSIPGRQAYWKTIEHAVPLKVQKRTGDIAEGMIASISATLTGKSAAESFRIVLEAGSAMELATASSREEASGDVEMLQMCLVGTEPEKLGAVPEAVRRALAKYAASHSLGGSTRARGTAGLPSGGAVRGGSSKALSDSIRAGDTAGLPQGGAVRGGGSKALSDAAAFAKQLEPWAVSLMDNADKLRYVCYAFKAATSLGADLATAGLGGEEVVGLCFTSVDAAILSSWLVWFTAQLSEDSPADSIVRQTLAFDFAEGPRALTAQADALCAAMRPEDVEHITKCALMLKRRFAVLVGDIISLLIPNDMGVGGAVVTEMLMCLEPEGAVDALKQLISWYEMIKPEHRQMLEDRGQLVGTVQSANNSVRTYVLSQYDKSLGQKGLEAAKRGVVSVFIPGGILVNAAATAAIAGNVGRGPSAEVFDTLDNKISDSAVMMHSVLGVAIGTLVIMAHCADRADPASKGAGKGARTFSVANLIGDMAVKRMTGR
jgi:hypothetical protein